MWFRAHLNESSGIIKSESCCSGKQPLAFQGRIYTMTLIMNMHRGLINILYNLPCQFTCLFVRLFCAQFREPNYGLINSLSHASSWMNTREGQTHALGSLSRLRVETHKMVQHILLLSKLGMSNLQPEGKILLKSNRWYDPRSSTRKLSAEVRSGFMHWFLYK